MIFYSCLVGLNLIVLYLNIEKIEKKLNKFIENHNKAMNFISKYFVLIDNDLKKCSWFIELEKDVYFFKNIKNKIEIEKNIEKAKMFDNFTDVENEFKILKNQFKDAKIIYKRREN